MTASGNESDDRLFGATRVAMPEGARPLSPRDDRWFAAWVGLAALLHALLLLAFIRAEPKRLGDAAGIENAIAVEFVPDPDPSSRATVADSSAGQPAPPAPPPSPPPAAQAPPSPPAPPPSPPPAPEPVAAPVPPAPPLPPPEPPTPATEPPPAPPALLPTLTAPDAAELTPPADVAKAEPTPPTPPRPTEKPPERPTPAPEAAKPKAQPAKPDAQPPKPVRDAQPKPAAPPKPKPTPPTPPAPPQRTANLDLSNPAARPQSFNAPVGGGSGGVERPPGITRSGANDLFAREVIRALQRTMPQLRDTFGRVTVRLTLDKNGNHKETIVLRPSNVPGLDRSVVFATQQSSFPLPPAGHKPDDLIFFVTYIYR